ncbi:MAG: cytochrome b/b6 domain-containing protein [Phycisphaerae bacterium]|nr:cytochrome b/b6 domain-containing protein [Phycisphaerae bacterium]
MAIAAEYAVERFNATVHLRAHCRETPGEVKSGNLNPFAMVLFVALAIVAGSAPALGQVPATAAPQASELTSLGGKPDTTKCLACHHAEYVPDLPKQVVPFSASVHGDLDCTDCHAGIEQLAVPESLPPKKPPHPIHLPPVDCGDCHDDEAALYTMHGPGVVGKNPDIPTCARCHGAHDILSPSDPRSHVNPDRLPDTCRRCHGKVDLAKKYYQLSAAFVSTYHISVHGTSAIPGSSVAATCEDCHAAAGSNGKRSAHLILGPASPKSSIYYFNIPNTCGRCHKAIVKDYWAGIHGQLVARGEVGAPVCTRCHGEHGIFRITDPRSPVSPTQVAVQTCSPCHDSVVLSQRYGLPGGRLNTYVGSYHGLKARAGDTLVANCASCHGAHRVLPSSDPDSSINQGNLQHTCGHCHPGISQRVASTPIHQTETTMRSGWAHFFTEFYIALIAVTIGFMVVHNVGDWWSTVRDQASKPLVVRLSTNEVAQHWVLMLSFVVLVVTGFGLRFDQSWWARLMFGWDNGFTVRGIIHRVAGTVLILASFWHLVYLFGARGRRWLRDMIASRKDLADLKQNALHFLGLKKHRARFGRFSYLEKAEYWALVWGTIIMSITGLLLWFDNDVAPYFPKGFLQVALVIHYYEAWLATLAILIWHIYGTVFRPAITPMNPAWWSGKMPKGMYDEEHPESPEFPAGIRSGLSGRSAGDEHLD